MFLIVIKNIPGTITSMKSLDIQLMKIMTIKIVINFLHQFLVNFEFTSLAFSGSLARYLLHPTTILSIMFFKTPWLLPHQQTRSFGFTCHKIKYLMA